MTLLDTDDRTFVFSLSSHFFNFFTDYEKETIHKKGVINMTLCFWTRYTPNYSDYITGFWTINFKLWVKWAVVLAYLLDWVKVFNTFHSWNFFSLDWEMKVSFVTLQSLFCSIYPKISGICLTHNINLSAAERYFLICSWTALTYQWIHFCFSRIQLGSYKAYIIGLGQALWIIDSDLGFIFFHFKRYLFRATLKLIMDRGKCSIEN